MSLRGWAPGPSNWIKYLGFGTTCNRGAEANEKDFVFFCNPDSMLTSKCCRLLDEAAERYSNAAAVNPAISNGKDAIRLNRRSALIVRHAFTDRCYA